ncbi:MAG: GNAT family N-acetyltransferase [Lentimicrobiaceae bacterium]|nr:GNAT family N-acetyltransferase [Lentimicrobiaceae bacterium]
MIRKATHNDIPRILELLSQVNDVHAEGRPDFFIKGKRKYNEEDLLKIINDDTTPVFVCEENDDIKGYAFCVIQDLSQCDNLRPDKSLYIDDICVDENYRRHGVGKKLYEHVVQFAKEEKCFNITLNVWAKNPGAQAFYESMGMTVQKVCMEQILIDN